MDEEDLDKEDETSDSGAGGEVVAEDTGMEGETDTDSEPEEV